MRSARLRCGLLCVGGARTVVGDEVPGDADTRVYVQNWPTRVVGALRGPCWPDHTNSARNRHVPGGRPRPAAHARTQIGYQRVHLQYLPTQVGYVSSLCSRCSPDLAPAESTHSLSSPSSLSLQVSRRMRLPPPTHTHIRRPSRLIAGPGGNLQPRARLVGLVTPSRLVCPRVLSQARRLDNRQLDNSTTRPDSNPPQPPVPAPTPTPTPRHRP